MTIGSVSRWPGPQFGWSTSCVNAGRCDGRSRRQPGCPTLVSTSPVRNVGLRTRRGPSLSVRVRAPSVHWPLERSARDAVKGTRTTPFRNWCSSISARSVGTPAGRGRPAGIRPPTHRWSSQPPNPTMEQAPRRCAPRSGETNPAPAGRAASSSTATAR
jgi:hypothetical protein